MTPNLLHDLKLEYYDDDNNRIYTCPLCGGKVKVLDNTFYGRCDTCLATLIDYKPQPHQVDFHKSKAKYRLNIGGYGTGKTTMDAAEVANHILSVPNGRTLITSQTLQQVKEAVLPELEKFLPPWFFAKKPTKSPTPKYYMKNGHEIIVYASNNEEKIRSLNLTCFWIVEASGVSYKIFTQLQSRLRNKAAVVKDKEGFEIAHNFMGIIESNPEEGWIRNEFLLRSGKIFASKSVDIKGYEKLKTKKPEDAYHSFLSASVDNEYLPRSFVKDLCVGKSNKWIRKYVYCYLEVREGVVYPDFQNSLVDPFPIPKEWKRVMGFDKGYSDQTTLACGAVDPNTGICYIYDEYFQNEKPISYHARHIKEMVDGLNIYRGIQADPTVRNRNERDGVTYRDYFYRVSGIYLQEGINDLLTGIEKVRDLMYEGKLKIFTSCVNLSEEAQNYKWKIDKQEDVATDNPVDKNNHLLDALRYLCMILPFNQRDIYMGDVGNSSTETKSNILDRIQPTGENNYMDGVGGVYGLGVYQL